VVSQPLKPILERRVLRTTREINESRQVELRVEPIEARKGQKNTPGRRVSRQTSSVQHNEVPVTQYSNDAAKVAGGMSLIRVKCYTAVPSSTTFLNSVDTYYDRSNA
jgi:hypothetical protein